MLIGLVLTKSITGIFINVISFIVFVLIKNKKGIINYIKLRKGKVIIIFSLLLIAFGVGVFVMVEKNINEVYVNETGKIVAKNRIADIILSVRNGDIDRLTSQKTRDWRLFLNDYKNSSTIKKIFGKGMDTYLVYSSYFKKEVASHSAYIDILCCYGIVGMIIIVWYLIRKLKNNIILLSHINNKVFRYVRIILLVYALELNIYTNRVFLLMFLL